MNATPWTLDQADIEQGAWFVWDEGAAEDEDLTSAVEGFEAVDRGNPEAAEEATEWLRNEAAGQQACVTRILVAGGHVAAFYALSSAEMEISATQNLREMGIATRLGPAGKARVGSTHIEVIGRDSRAPSGTGRLAVRHAFAVALLTASLQGNRALTLDPRDSSTDRMWKEMGFRSTERDVGGGLHRLYAPVFGPYYGGLERA